MTIYSETMEVFLNEHTGNISRSLAENVITQHGGETAFILNRDKYMDGEIWAVAAWAGLHVRCSFFIENKAEILKAINKEREACSDSWLARFRDAAMVDGSNAEELIDNDTVEQDANLMQGISLYIAAILARSYYHYSLKFELDLPDFSPMPDSWHDY